MTEEIHALTDEIHALMAEPAARLERLEDTLTTGYARALELEAERGRLERQLGEVVATGDGAGARELAAQVTKTDEHLTRLRALLGALRERTSAARV